VTEGTDDLGDARGLKTHRETREGDVYDLTMVRDDREFGPRMARTEVECDLRSERLRVLARSIADTLPACGLFVTMNAPARQARFGSTPMSSLVEVLTHELGTAVTDRTGLDGRFDLILEWTDPTAAPVPSQSGTTPAAPTLTTAVQEQLGLKLERKRGPVDVIVVDDIRRPDPD